MTTTTIVAPSSEEYTLVAATPQVVGAHKTPLTVHIKTGTSCDVFATCSTPAEIEAGTADWVDLTTGAKAGPALVNVPGPYTAIKLLSAAGGTAWVCRSRDF